MHLTSKLGGLVGLAVLTASAAAIFFACGTNGADPVNGGSNGGTPAVDRCATPNDGCACATPGQVVECGKVQSRHGDYVTCSMGTRECGADGTWGLCVGNTVVTKSAGLIHTKALQDAGAACAPGVNDCDPYCNSYTDNGSGVPVGGGLGLVDGGITVIGSPADGGPVVPGGALTTNTGKSTCGAALNLIGGACTPATELTTCRQDSRCNPATNTCEWNGAEGYYKPTAGGVDLTIATACDAGGGNGNFAICNRGSAAVAAGVSLGVNLVATGAVPDPCTAVFATPDPGCAVTTPAGGLKPGQCLNLTCPVAGDKYAIVNASSRDVAEPTNCANNVAYASITGAACAACVNCDTKVTGTVKDPGKNVGLSGINVYQAATTPITLTDGVTCDTCASLETPYIAAAGTDTSGAFTLSRVTPGTNMTFISQSGRWRRVANITVPACGTTALTDDQIRMPKNKAEGNIPKTAIVQGNQESLECALLKIGVDAAEIAMRVNSADTARFQVYRQNGPTMSTGTPLAAPANLWSVPATMNEYTAIIQNCDGGSGSGGYTFGAGVMGGIEAYAAAGGRIFADHWGPYYMGSTGPTFAATSTWSNVFTTPPTAKGKVNSANAAQTLYRDWLFANGASTMWGLGWLQVDNPRKNVVTPNPALATEWIRGANGTMGNPEGDWAGNPTGNYSLSMSFETPVGSATPCGRVIMNDMHVSQTRMAGGFPYGSGQKFPTNCNLGSALSPEEKALEYQIFQLTACALGGSPPPPPPPPPPPLPTVTFVRDYSATCPSGTAPVWQLFQWQASIPVGTRIDFRAATSPTVAGLPATPGAAPQSVPIGSATADVLAPSWGNDANTVDWHLRNDPPGPPNPSKSNLRVFMTFVPTATVSPTLWSWRQLYDCAPAE